MRHTQDANWGMSLALFPARQRENQAQLALGSVCCAASAGIATRTPPQGSRSGQRPRWLPSQTCAATPRKCPQPPVL